MDAMVGIVVVIFGIFWTMIAIKITSHIPFPLVGVIFPLFGVMFVIVGIINVIYSLVNTTSPNRFSEFDITTAHEEPDPLNQVFGARTPQTRTGQFTIEAREEEPAEDRLRELQSLRTKNLITEDEYATQRRRILEEI